MVYEEIPNYATIITIHIFWITANAIRFVEENFLQQARQTRPFTQHSSCLETVCQYRIIHIGINSPDTYGRFHLRFPSPYDSCWWDVKP